MMVDLQFRIILNLEHCLMGGKGRFQQSSRQQSSSHKKTRRTLLPGGFLIF
ncbi:hypothetical protein [Agrobacterium vitis]|uniref:Uncharacterized protein n=1 Tax=Agrobacterium vitis TaxID=373 RepID=A0A7K1RG48_AGRVI|nr:hypothetical protein [Agrobacterium vitis]MVA56982.1 hypothetical protein [Agrobacterium vitis]